MNKDLAATSDAMKDLQPHGKSRKEEGLLGVLGLLGFRVLGFRGLGVRVWGFSERESIIGFYYYSL